jgi:ATP-dependent DNA ligase
MRGAWPPSSCSATASPKALYAFDLLELNGTDLRREPIEVRKATLASILPKSRPGVRLIT